MPTPRAEPETTSQPADQEGQTVSRAGWDGWRGWDGWDGWRGQANQAGQDVGCGYRSPSGYETQCM